MNEYIEENNRESKRAILLKGKEVEHNCWKMIKVDDGDKVHVVVTETLEAASMGSMCDNYGDFNIEEILSEHHTLKKSNAELEGRIAKLESEVNLLKELVRSGSCVIAAEQDPSVEVEGVEKIKSFNIDAMSCSMSGSMLKKLYLRLYNFCVQRCSLTEGKRVLVSMYDGYLERNNLQSLKSRNWVDNMVVYFAAKFFMANELEKGVGIKRYIFTPRFSDIVVAKVGCFGTKSVGKWTMKEFSCLATNRNTPISLICGCDLVFVPTILNKHWYCYVLHLEDRKIFVLDSCRDTSTERERVDEAMKEKLQELFRLLLPTRTIVDADFELIYDPLPQQRMMCDCGIYLLKYMELWDGIKSWDGMHMPDFTVDEIQQFRRGLVCQWVLHPLNEHKTTTLMSANLVEDLYYDEQFAL
ncbi:uncharacterized protein LOC108346995 isoform X2 [Vigna angularis]|uniref:uncharacterized protein LOC108346995 isoform X2 n=1 Tax=Phaseolus angularis TaxID=3914 RepID=UPI000809B8FC|nr:uncharacterized protein LOC108346995 isoform X2 [Vigna angularis]